MKIPKKVRILGRTFEVALIEGGNRLRGAWGCVNIQNRTIFLDKTIGPESLLAVLLHEIDEAILLFTTKDYDHEEFEKNCEIRFATYCDNGLCFNIDSGCGVKKKKK